MLTPKQGTSIIDLSGKSKLLMELRGMLNIPKFSIFDVVYIQPHLIRSSSFAIKGNIWQSQYFRFSITSSELICWQKHEYATYFWPHFVLSSIIFVSLKCWQSNEVSLLLCLLWNEVAMMWLVKYSIILNYRMFDIPPCSDFTSFDHQSFAFLWIVDDRTKWRRNSLAY